MAIKPYFDKNGVRHFEVYVTMRSAHGHRHQVRKRGFKSIRAAEVHEFEAKRLLCDKKKNPLYTWSEWHALCVSRLSLELTRGTIMNYDGRLRKWVHPVWDGRLLSSISSLDVHELIFNNLQGLSDNSRRTILKLICKIFQMAVNEGVIERNPTLSLKVKVAQPKQAVLNANEVNVLLQEAKVTEHRFYPVWATALLTGMRSGELFALKWTDVDFSNKRISVTRSWSSKSGYHSTKTGRNRVVPISGDLETLLKEIKLKTGIGSEFVLPRLSEWETGQQAQVLRDFCETIGITQVKFHDLRATFITQLLLKGVSLAQVMAVVGHTQLKTTNVYLRVVGSDLDGVTEKLSYSLPQDKLGRLLDFSRSD